MLNIYVSSNWNNQLCFDVMNRIMESGHDVCDFHTPPQRIGRFHWPDVDPSFIEWSVNQYREGVKRRKIR